MRSGTDPAFYESLQFRILLSQLFMLGQKLLFPIPVLGGKSSCTPSCIEAIQFGCEALRYLNGRTLSPFPTEAGQGHQPLS